MHFALLDFKYVVPGFWFRRQFNFLQGLSVSFSWYLIGLGLVGGVAMMSAGWLRSLETRIANMEKRQAMSSCEEGRTK